MENGVPTYGQTSAELAKDMAAAAERDRINREIARQQAQQQQERETRRRIEEANRQRKNY